MWEHARRWRAANPAGSAGGRLRVLHRSFYTRSCTPGSDFIDTNYLRGRFFKENAKTMRLSRKVKKHELHFHNLQRPRLRAAFAAKLPSWRSKLKAQGWSRGAAQHYAGLAMRTLSHFMVASRIAAL